MAARVHLGLFEAVSLVEGALDDMAGLHMPQLSLKHGAALGRLVETPATTSRTGVSE
jgi:hypothetical protein